MNKSLINDFGLVKEPTEATWYLVRREEERPKWFTAIGVYVGDEKISEGYENPDNFRMNNVPLYSVLESDVIKLQDEGLIKKLLESKRQE